MNASGKIALVSGGASGLGLATARALIDRDASVVLLDLPSSRGEEVAKELGERCAFFAGDVTSEDDVQAAVATAADRFGALHIAVSCAGIATPGRLLNRDGAPLPIERFESVVKVNLIGTFNVMRFAAAQMVQQEPDGEERGVMINTASVAAFEGQIGQVAYSASKGAVAALTLPVARDLARRQVRCAAIAPGTFDTPMMEGLGDTVRAKLAEDTPHPHRLGTPQEYADLALHIIANPMLNGTVIRLDGALRMPP